jgi:hypothetical protein
VAKLANFLICSFLLGLSSGSSLAAEVVCNAYAYDAGGIYIGCLGATLVGPALCSNVRSDCVTPTNLPCGFESYATPPHLDAYCPAFAGESLPGEVIDHADEPEKEKQKGMAEPSEIELEVLRRKAAEEAQKKLQEESLARRRELEAELEKKGAALVKGQGEALKNADEVSTAGMNEAATVGTLWCAHGANHHAKDRDLAEQSFGTCKDYMGAADSLRAIARRSEGFEVNNQALTGEFAESTLSAFEKNFGISSANYLGRFL